MTPEAFAILVASCGLALPPGITSERLATIATVESGGRVDAISPPNRDGSDLYVRLTGRELRGDYVVTARPTPGFPDGNWPPLEGMSLERNLDDLRRHAADFEARTGFTFTVLEPVTRDVIQPP